MSAVKLAAAGTFAFALAGSAMTGAAGAETLAALKDGKSIVWIDTV